MAPQRHRAQRAVKRAFDVVVAAGALLVLSPLMALIAAAILLTMGPPVLFRHRRLGLRGPGFNPFEVPPIRGPPPRPGAPPRHEPRGTPPGPHPPAPPP